MSKDFIDDELKLLCYTLAHAKYQISREIPNKTIRERHSKAWSHIIYLIETSTKNEADN